VRASGFAKPAVPVEVQIARLNTVRSIVPSLFLAGSIVGAGYFLTQMMAASPSAQMVQAYRDAAQASKVAAEQSTQAVKAAAEASGCQSLICINLGGQQKQPELPPVVIQQPQPDYYQPQPQPQPVQPTVPTIPAANNPQSVNYWRAAQYDQQFIDQSVGWCSQVSVNWQTPECQALAHALNQSATHY
jgi:hypothetical protein